MLSKAIYVVFFMGNLLEINEDMRGDWSVTY